MKTFPEVSLLLMVHMSHEEHRVTLTLLGEFAG